MFLQYQDGLVDEELWQAHSRQAQAALNDSPLIAQFWRLRREFFTPAYREFRDAQIDGKGEAVTLGYQAKPAAPVAGPSIVI
jgi:hypothetical protein